MLHKIKTVFFFLLLFFCHKVIFCQNGNFNWVINAGGLLFDGSRSVATDKSNNAYITGEFQQQAVFDTSTLFSDNYGLFLAKYSESDGSLIWVQQAAAGQDIFSLCVATDNNNNVYITGYFIDTLTIGDTIIPSPSGLSTLFLAKYSGNGQFLWARSAHSDDEATGYYIAVNSLNELYLVAMFRHTITFSNDTTLTGYPFRHSAAIVKFNDSGSLVYVRQISGYDCVHAGYIYIDNADNYYISGLVFDNADLGGTVINNSDGSDYLAKYNANNQLLWVKQSNGADFKAISTDTDFNVYTGGQIIPNTVIENVNLQPNGLTDVFIAKYNSSGNFIWVKQAGGNGEDCCNTICSNGNNEFYLGGNFNNVAFFGNDSVASKGGSDMFIAKSDSSGNFSFVKSFGSIYNDNCYSIAFSSAEKLFLTGMFVNELFWENDSLSGNGSDDAFLAVLNNVINDEKNIIFSPYIRFYPNPSENYITIEFPEIEKETKIEFINTIGQIVYFQVIENNPNNGTFKFDVSSFPKGIYIIKVSGNNYSYLGKLLKK